MDQQTIDTYNKIALKYDKDTTVFWKRFPRTFFNKFIELNLQAKVLNIGSGPGREGLILQKGGLEVTCLDASERMVEISRERGLDSVVGDFQDMPFGDSYFDAVWAYTALLHVQKSAISEVMQEIVRVIKPQGYLGLGFIEGDSEGYRVREGEKGSRWFSYYEKQEIEDLLQIHEFKSLYFEEFQPGSKKYLNFIARSS